MTDILQGTMRGAIDLLRKSATENPQTQTPNNIRTSRSGYLYEDVQALYSTHKKKITLLHQDYQLGQNQNVNIMFIKGLQLVER